MAGKATPATALLNSRGVAHELHEYRHDPNADSFGAEVACRLEVAPERVFKTLIAEVDGTFTMGLVPVPGQLDLKALAAHRGGKKARMADPSAAERATGYVAGGISPLGQRKQLPAVLDSAAFAFDTILCSAGRRGLQIELAADDLARTLDAQIATIHTT